MSTQTYPRDKPRYILGVGQLTGTNVAQEWG